MPGVAKVGGTCSRPVSLIDLYPTLIDLCGLSGNTKKSEEGHSLDGHSLKPLLVDPDHGHWTGPDTVLTALSKWGKLPDPAQQSYSLRSQEWRYIRYENGKEELYHTSNDPLEWNNLAGVAEYAKPLNDFRSQLLLRIPKSSSAAEPSAAEWKEIFFTKHPDADTNQMVNSVGLNTTSSKRSLMELRLILLRKLRQAQMVRYKRSVYFRKTLRVPSFSPIVIMEKFTM